MWYLAPTLRIFILAPSHWTFGTNKRQDWSRRKKIFLFLLLFCIILLNCCSICIHTFYVGIVTYLWWGSLNKLCHRNSCFISFKIRLTQPWNSWASITSNFFPNETLTGCPFFSLTFGIREHTKHCTMSFFYSSTRNENPKCFLCSPI